MAIFEQIAAANGFTAENIHYQLAHLDEDRGPLVVTVTTILIACALLTVALRLLTRRAILKISWKIDDYAILAAMVRTYRTGNMHFVDSPDRVLPWGCMRKRFSVLPSPNTRSSSGIDTNSRRSLWHRKAYPGSWNGRHDQSHKCAYYLPACSSQID